MKQRPLIQHVISSLHVGGAERMLVKLCGATRERFRHHIVTLIAGGALADDARAAGAKVEELGGTRSWRTLSTLSDLKSSVVRARSSVVLSWMYHANILSTLALAGMRERPPLLWNIRHTPSRLRDETLLTGAALLAGIPLQRSAARIIYNAERSAEWHERIGFDASRRVFIPNGFDLHLFQPDAQARVRFRAEHGIPPDAPLLGRVARSHPMKDDATLLAAFARVRQAYPEARLVLVGQGMDTENEELTAAAAMAGVADAILLLGRRADVHRITPAFDVALSSSSRGEAFPNVVGEAMACGVPMVTTDVGDAAAILDDPERVAPPGNAELLAVAVARLLDAGPEARARIGKRDRDLASIRYSLEAVAERYMALWNEVVLAPH
ncbi:hypothetical protein SLNSH_17430 [Alsobacter soli]|uniref:Glycosyltransferase subfamily 4-like N-terminal domain-containing protein n=1 Tax=Alsobacter soli TaxID=2109933 RepID=A0A2T1HQ13_9HYPH|nr:glycosyltransferase [Alsobacter soli]PSC03726.1 hypothetical protein SLNSH_17430 [Alsobacter soli]